MMKYKGYTAAAEFEDSVGRLHGRVANGGPYGRKYVRTGSRGELSGDVFGSSRWKETKEAYLERPGFRLSDKLQTTLGADYAFEEYVGTGRREFDLTLSVMWKLGRDEVSFEAAIDRSPLPTIGYRIPYPELASRTAEVDQAVEAMCRCMMDEIDSRSQDPPLHR